MSRRLAALVAAALLSGCATVTSGTSQTVMINSDPEGAECTVSRQEALLATVTTPAPVTLKRHAASLYVLCRKAGYEDNRVVINSRFENASAGNFLLGGVVGTMIDASSGASSRYEPSILVRLTPQTMAHLAVP